MRIKNNVKVIAVTLAIVMLMMGLLVVLIKVSDGFQKDFDDWKLHEVNEENLWQTVKFATIDDNGNLVAGNDGVMVSLTDDNVLKISGTAERSVIYTVGTVTLKEGSSYVFDSSFKGSAGTVYMQIKDQSNGTVLKACYGTPVIISAADLPADTVVVIELSIAAETDVDLSLKPVLCEGASVEELVGFYK